MKPSHALTVFLLSFTTANAAIALSDPSSGGVWVSLGANYDFLDDQQTGDPASDIVGTGVNPGFFTAFDNAGTPSLTDGMIAYRVRLDDHGGNTQNPKFDRNLWVGIDADLNGSIDAFLGVATPAQNVILGIYDAGTGANTSPSTTTIANLSPAYTYTTSAANYDYRAVNYLTDGGTLNDLTPTGTDTDYYVSFSFGLANIGAFLTAQLPSFFNQSNPFNQNTPLRYVLGTSTQSQSLNQDLGGIHNKNSDLTMTWTQLGGFSRTISAAGNPVPEVSAGFLTLIGSVFGFVFNRRRRS